MLQPPSLTLLNKLHNEIVCCEKCPRLRKHCRHIGKTKRKSFMDWDYWGKPLPGFGDPTAKLLIIGLAPAANGGTRTGRMFCGDSSGDWLIRALHETGFANQSTSTSRDDGLELIGAYVTAVARCAPPENKPTRKEIANCLPYLREELRLLKDVKVVLALGHIAFKGFLEALETEHSPQTRTRPKFSHGSAYDLGTGLPKLYASYHPSRRNTQTKMLSWEMWIRTFQEIRHELDEESGHPKEKLTIGITTS